MRRLSVPDFGADPLLVSAYAPLSIRGGTARVLLPLLDTHDEGSAGAFRTWQSLAELAGIPLTSDTRLHELARAYADTIIPASGVVDLATAQTLLAVLKTEFVDEELAVFAFWEGYSEDQVEPDESIDFDRDRLGPWPLGQFLFVVRPVEFIVGCAERGGLHFPAYVWPLDLRFTFAMPRYGDSFFLTGGATAEELRAYGLEAFAIEPDAEIPVEGD